MTVPGPIKYARSGEVSIAYQEWGSGPVTLVAVPPLAQNIEIAWQNPYLQYYLERLGSFARCIHFDKRGTGASDAAAVPDLDMRVDDLRAVMDDAGVDEAFIAGMSEGGPLAILYTATYPERVRGLILDNTTARLVPTFVSEEAEQIFGYMKEELIGRWGTSESLTLELFAPSVAGDAWYREWEPYYERQSASPAAIRELIEMNLQIDVTEVAGSVDVPTLRRNRSGDLMIPIEVARETLSRIPGIEAFESEGSDHFPHIGSDVDDWLEVYQRFITGIQPRPTTRRYLDWKMSGRTDVRIRTLGGFGVVVDGREVEASEWGSRRARQLLKRLAAAGGAPVPREQLIEMLWPDSQDAERLSARLSVQLSMVRRVLGGGVVADRTSVRLDTARIGLDIVDLRDAARLNASDRVVEIYVGEFLPEDVYEEWTSAARAEARAAFVAAATRLASAAAQFGDPDRASELARRVLVADPYDEDAHRCLVGALADLGRYGEARSAYRSYTERMTELGVRSLPISEISESLR